MKATAGETNGLTVKLEVFHGPFELLFHLIKENEIDIWDIPIAVITEQYLAYLDSMRELNLDIAGEFLVMAATLLQIKAKMLLPSPEEEEEEEEGFDPREQLVQRLLTYRRFKQVAEELRKKESEWAGIYFRRVPLRDFPVRYENPVGDATVETLWQALQKVLVSRKEQQPTEHTIRQHYDLSERVLWLSERLLARKRLMFTELFSPHCPVGEIVVTFLALLELVKRKVVMAQQDTLFADIELRLAT